MAHKLPPYFRTVMWSYDFPRMDTEKDLRRIIIDTINYGGWRHWQWLGEYYGRVAVKNVIEAVPSTEFRPGALHLASLVYGVQEQAHASRSAYARRR